MEVLDQYRGYGDANSFFRAFPHWEGTLRFDEVMNKRDDVHMRTTISLDDRLAEQVRRRAAKEGLSVSAFIARTLDDALKRQIAPEAPPFRLVTVKGEGARPGVDLDRPRTLDVQEDEAVFSRRAHKP